MRDLGGHVGVVSWGGPRHIVPFIDYTPNIRIYAISTLEEDRDGSNIPGSDHNTDPRSRVPNFGGQMFEWRENERWVVIAATSPEQGKGALIRWATTKQNVEINHVGWCRLLPSRRARAGGHLQNRHKHRISDMDWACAALLLHPGSTEAIQEGEQESEPLVTLQ